MIYSGASTSRRADCGSTSLHFSCRCSPLAVVELLLKHDPTLINLKNDDGLLPIDIARTYRRIDIEQYLLSGNVKIGEGEGSSIDTSGTDATPTEIPTPLRPGERWGYGAFDAEIDH